MYLATKDQSDITGSLIVALAYMTKIMPQLRACDVLTYIHIETPWRDMETDIHIKTPWRHNIPVETRWRQAVCMSMGRGAKLFKYLSVWIKLCVRANS